MALTHIDSLQILFFRTRSLKERSVQSLEYRVQLPCGLLLETLRVVGADPRFGPRWINTQIAPIHVSPSSINAPVSCYLQDAEGISALYEQPPHNSMTNNLLISYIIYKNAQFMKFFVYNLRNLVVFTYFTQMIKR